MKMLALHKAKGRLGSAQRALQLMNEESAMGAFVDHWIDFLGAWKATYNKVQQAAKDTPQEMQWFGRVQRERRADPLLRYLFEARNDEEHGLVISTSMTPGVAVYRMTRDGADASVVFKGGAPTGIFGADGESSAELVRHIPQTAMLHPVKDRSGNVISPPTSHNGQAIEPKAITAAELGLRYLAALLAEAEAMIAP